MQKREFNVRVVVKKNGEVSIPWAMELGPPKKLKHGGVARTWRTVKAIGKLKKLLMGMQEAL